MEDKYITLENLEVYKYSCQLSEIAWDIYKDFDWQIKKIIGDQFIRSADSVGANIAEGYSRFHYLDKIRFYYNARASLSIPAPASSMSKCNSLETERLFPVPFSARSSRKWYSC